MDTRVVCLVLKILAWYIDPNGIENKNILTYPYPTGMNNDVILIIDPRMVPNQYDTSGNHNLSKLH